MSKSFRHFPLLSDQQRHNKCASFFKRTSNKWVRHHDVPNGCSYKKNGFTYDICDYKTSPLWSNLNFWDTEEIMRAFRK